MTETDLVRDIMAILMPEAIQAIGQVATAKIIGATTAIVINAIFAFLGIVCIIRGLIGTRKSDGSLETWNTSFAWLAPGIIVFIMTAIIITICTCELLQWQEAPLGKAILLLLGKS